MGELGSMDMPLDGFITVGQRSKSHGLHKLFLDKLLVYLTFNFYLIYFSAVFFFLQKCYEIVVICSSNAQLFETSIFWNFFKFFFSLSNTVKFFTCCLLKDIKQSHGGNSITKPWWKFYNSLQNNKTTNCRFIQIVVHV